MLFILLLVAAVLLLAAINLGTVGAALGIILSAITIPASSRGQGPLTTDTEDCDSYCYTRWDFEIRACASPNIRNKVGCKQRAIERRNICVSNGGVVRDDEPPAWSELDE